MKQVWPQPKRNSTDTSTPTLQDCSTPAIRLTRLSISPMLLSLVYVWEFIRSVKNLLHAIIRSQTLINDTFNTVLCKIKHFMNAKPITTVWSWPDDIKLFTPNRSVECMSACHLCNSNGFQQPIKNCNLPNSPLPLFRNAWSFNCTNTTSGKTMYNED